MRTMHKAIAAFALLTLGNGGAMAATGLGGDGCYQLYKPSVLYPVVCISGSNEEGIGGSGARVALVGPNSSEVSWCAVTTSITVSGGTEGSATERTYHFDSAKGITAISFAGEVKDGREEGRVTMSDAKKEIEVEYLELLPEHVSRLDHVFTSDTCKKAGI